jgi:DNA-binding GntR family transcriptional regulator
MEADMTREPRVEKLGAAHSPLTKLVADAIRGRILSGELAPGDRLVESFWSDELGVSRMPVREALRSLAAEGVVTIEPRRGATVTAYTPEQVQELVEVRATLEALNAKLAAKRLDREQLDKLEQLLAAGAQVNEGSALAKVQQDNDEFHETLALAASNTVLRDLVRMLRERTAVIFAPHSAKRAKENWGEHSAILRAVIDGDAELAGLLAARHVYGAAQALPAHLRLPARDGEPDDATASRALRRTGT